MKFIYAMLLAFAAMGVQAADIDGVVAVVSYESERLGADGVWKTSRYKERFFRSGEHVWIERIVPAIAPAPASAGDQHGQERKVLETAAKHITKASGERADLVFVVPQSKTIVALRADDMPAVGFDGRWESAYHIIKPSLIQSMRKVGAARDGAVWYEKESGQALSKILWSEPLALPLRIESRST